MSFDTPLDRGTQRAGNGSETPTKRRRAAGESSPCANMLPAFENGDGAGSTELTFAGHVRSSSNSFAASHPAAWQRQIPHHMSASDPKRTYESHLTSLV